MNADPAIRAAQAAGIKAALAKPEVREGYLARLKYSASHPSDAERARRREHGLRMYERVLKSPEVIAKRDASKKRAGAKRSDTVLAWCPVEHRAEYRALTRSRKLTATEAKEYILSKIAREERDRIAALSPLERQLGRVRNGARVIAKPDFRSVDPSYSLVGNATGML